MPHDSSIHSHHERRTTMTIRGERRRDNQQWMLDWMVKTTGRVQNFANETRALPPEVKSYRMIPRVTAKHGRRQEEMARAAEKAGHRETACELYWRATEHYIESQHAIFHDDDNEKIYLHGNVLHCVPGVKKAPAVLFCPGMDMTKESYMMPGQEPYVARGFNCLHIDGPG